MPNLAFDQLIQHLNAPERQALRLQEKLTQTYQRQQLDAVHQEQQWLLDPERYQHELAVLTHLIDTTLHIQRAHIDQAPTLDKGVLSVVTGAPGSGKSHLALQHVQQLSAYYSCSDAVKRTVIQTVQQMSPQNQARLGPQWTNALFLHRLTSRLSWQLCDEALAARKPVVLEMLGSNANQDATWLNALMDQGVCVSVHHVGTSTQRAIQNATTRYFDPSPTNSDYQRYISLKDLVDTQYTLMQSFLSLARQTDPQAHYYFYDNQDLEMRLFEHWVGPQIPPSLPDHIEHLCQMIQAPKELWFKGVNHTVDFVILDPTGTEVFLIERGSDPFEGFRAFPGGFVDTSAAMGEPFVLGVETPIQAAYRELAEETLMKPESLDLSTLMPVGFFDHPLRDPRNSDDRRAGSHAFLIQAREKPTNLQASDDAKGLEWVCVDDILAGKIPMAFDHQHILTQAMKLFHQHQKSFTRPAHKNSRPN